MAVANMTKTLTGKSRVRLHTRWFKNPLLVLEVEVRAKGRWFDHTEMGNDRDVDYTYWRDARVEDIQELAKETK